MYDKQSITDDELIRLAKEAKKKSIAIFSNFHVGAALLTSTGEVYTGCNIENYSLSLSICAERVALFKAISDGADDFTKIAIASDDDYACYPCGVCRQALFEFAPKLKVLVNKEKGGIQAIDIAKLLPYPFEHKNDRNK